VFTKLTNPIGKIKYALYGVKLNAKNFILLHIDDTLLKTTPDINQTLLQFIDVMNLVDLLLLLHFSPSMSSMTQVISGANVSLCVFM